MRAVDTFFRGHRRETIIDGAAILCNPAGEKRLKLSMRIPLSGDQLVGMPTWVSEPFDDIAKPEFAVKSVASSMELDPMILRVFALPDSEKELIVYDGVRMCGFKIERDTQDEHPVIVLTFTAYLPRTGKFLKFADDYFTSSVFIRYEAAQQSLLDDNPNVQPVDPAEDLGKIAKLAKAAEQDEDDDEDEDDDNGQGDDDDETEEEEIVQPEQPKEAAAPTKAKQKKTTLGKRVDGYGRPISSRVQ
jgi:hypothetical protein